MRCINSFNIPSVSFFALVYLRTVEINASAVTGKWPQQMSSYLDGCNFTLVGFYLLKPEKSTNFFIESTKNAMAYVLLYKKYVTVP
jgi:hypothetical protein